MSDEKGLRILIAGSGRLGHATMNPLLKSHHEIVGVVHNVRAMSTWKQKILPLQYRLLNKFPSPMREAVVNNIPTFGLSQMDEKELAPLRSLKPDLLITCGFSIILPESILSLPRIGCINVHTALLPKHRGATPCGHVILQNESESGVTIHVTDEGIDSGDILMQERFTLETEDNSMDVYYASCALTESMILDAVNTIAKQDFAHAVAQDQLQASYDPRIDETMVRIDWRKSAEEIERLIRAAYIYSPAFFEFRGERIHVSQATCSRTEHKVYPGTILSMNPSLEVATGSGSLIMRGTYTPSMGGTMWPRMTTRLKVGMALD